MSLGRLLSGQKTASDLKHCYTVEELSPNGGDLARRRFATLNPGQKLSL